MNLIVIRTLARFACLVQLLVALDLDCPRIFDLATVLIAPTLIYHDLDFAIVLIRYKHVLP